MDILPIIVAIIISLIGGFLFGRRTGKKPREKKVSVIYEKEHRDDHLSPEFLSSLGLEPDGSKKAKSDKEARSGRLILVARTLPIKSFKKDGQWQLEWEDARSFIANLNLLRSKMEVLWIGAPDVQIAAEEQEQYEELLEKHNCVPVYMPADLMDRFYNGFCKGVFWPLLHYIMPQSDATWGKKWDSLWQAYQSANMLYSQAISRVCDSANDTIWIHNYHLLLVPSFLRKKLPKARIGIYMHTTFPSSDVVRVLPARENLLRGIMCADLIGFHTFDYARHFLSACKRVLDLDFETMPGGSLGIKYSGRFVSIVTSHVGIRAQEFRNALSDPKVQQQVHMLRSRFGGRKIIVGIDDFDLAKGSILKLQAYARFLSSHSEWLNKVVLLECITPSRNAPEEREQVRAAVNAELKIIKEQFGPDVIEVMEREELTLSEVVAFYNASSVAVITTFWDGMNLSPFEYTVSQSDDNPGVLVLSEFMGCSRSLSGVKRVNPWSLESVSDAIYTALTMPLDDRIAKHKRRAMYVQQHSLEKWATSFLRHLDFATHLADDLHFVQVGWGSNVRLVGLRSDFTHMDDSLILPRYRSSAERIILLDYDGTLTPNTTDQYTRNVAPSADLKSALKLLCADARNVVFILTGRVRKTLRDWFADIPELGLACEKGAFLRWPARLAGRCREDKYSLPTDLPEDAEWECRVNLAELTWKSLAMKLIKAYTKLTDGSWIEDKESAIVWHYEEADPEYGRMQASELAKYLVKVIESFEMDVVRYDYNRILEVKPRGVGKGYAATNILKQVLGGKVLLSASEPDKRPDPFLLCIGDDVSDEETYVAVSNRHDVNPAAAGSVHHQGRRLSQPSISTPPPSPPLLSSVPESKKQAQSLLDSKTDSDDESDDEEEKKLKKPIPKSSSTTSVSKLGKGQEAAGRAGFRTPASTPLNLTEMRQRGPGSASNNLAALVAEDDVDDIRVPKSKPHATPSEVGFSPRSSNSNPDNQSSTFTCCVGIKPSNAKFYLHDDEEVTRLLQALALVSKRRGSQEYNGPRTPSSAK